MNYNFLIIGKPFDSDHMPCGIAERAGIEINLYL